MRSLAYADAYVPPVAKGVEKGPESPGEETSNWPWLVVIALLFLVVGISLSGVKKSLTNAVLEAEGKEPLPDMTMGQKIRNWAWHNKAFASIIGLFLVVFMT
jgi:hypothetical protein